MIRWTSIVLLSSISSYKKISNLKLWWRKLLHRRHLHRCIVLHKLSVKPLLLMWKSRMRSLLRKLMHLFYVSPKVNQWCPLHHNMLHSILLKVLLLLPILIMSHSLLFSSQWCSLRFSSQDQHLHMFQSLGLRQQKKATNLKKKNVVENNFFSLEMKKSSPKEESSGALVEELKRVSAENKKLTGMLTEMCENYNTLRNNLMEYMRKNPDKESSPSKKRKSDEISSSNNNLMGGGEGGGVNGNNSESSSSDEDQSCKKPMELETCIKAKVSRVYYKQESSDSSLIVKDGYQWRKYGQKVTRDNPSPRAYFKCSFAPSCTVKKKVQRSVEDPSVVVATYEGEHNHPHPSQMESTSSGTNNRCRNPISSAVPSSAPSTVTIDWTKSKCSNESSSKKMMINNPKMEVPQILVEQMATSLTKDLNFRAALAAAISGKMLHQS